MGKPQKHLKNTSRQFPLKEIARQAGLSLATVDRVLHQREGVSRLTEARVSQALRELEHQGDQAALSGRKFMIDLVMEAPQRFSALTQRALEQEMPKLHPAAFRCRFHVADIFAPGKLVQTLERIAKRGSNGVILKAPDVPEVAQAINQLADQRIPVVTFVTDVPHSRRLSYVGIDNRAAGQTAAFLIGSWLGDGKAKVLASLSSNRFRGEEEREIGFKRAMREHYPQFEIIEISEGFGRDATTAALTRLALEKDPRIAAVYSIGGGNSAITKIFADMNRALKVYVGHDLDADNRRLLEKRKISAILHHDIAADMRRACTLIMQASERPRSVPSNELSHMLVITPFNVPDEIS